MDWLAFDNISALNCKKNVKENMPKYSKHKSKEVLLQDWINILEISMDKFSFYLVSWKNNWIF